MLLLDTDVMIDVLRGHDVALEWLQSLADETIGLPGFVALELLQGCRNRQEQQRVRRTLRPFALHWPNEHDCTRAYDDFAAFLAKSQDRHAGRTDRGDGRRIRCASGNL